MKLQKTIIAAASLFGAILACTAQGTAFTYQGRLNSGGWPANGSHDLVFAAYDTNGPTGNLVAGPVTNSAVPVSNGLFTVTLDFGAGVFAGNPRWLEIAVRTNGGGAFNTLTPRQLITATPYAIMANSASNLLGTLSAAQLTGTIPAAGISGTYGNPVSFNNGADAFDGTFIGQFVGSSFTGGIFTGQFLGDGSGLINLNASQLVSGTVPDARLAANVVRTNQTWLLNGNAGTAPGTNFLGTVDNQPLILKVHGQEAMRYEPTTDTPNVVGGYGGNYVQSGLPGVTIGGGGTLNEPNVVTNNGQYAVIAGGFFNTVNAYGGAILGGSVNDVGSDWAVIGGGQYHANMGRYGFIGGGFENVIQTNASESTIAGGFENSAQSYADESFIGGGYGNTIQGDQYYSTNQFLICSTIAGGGDNAIYTNSPYAAIGGGAENSIQANDIAANIAGGFNNTIQSNSVETFIGGGGENSVQANSQGSAIVGGNGNGIQNNAPYSFLGGGYYNVIQSGAGDSVIGGGQYNTNNSSFAFIGGGLNHFIQFNALGAFIGAGYQNSILTGSGYSVVGGGYENTVLAGAGYAVIGGGTNNQAGGFGAVVPGGFGNSATGLGSFAAGTFAQATNDGAFVLADSGYTNFYSTTSNQLSARFTGGVRFLTGGAGVTVDGQKIGPASGSANYIQNQTVTAQAAGFDISGNVQIGGLIRSGSETGTGNAPSPAGLVIRRINSLSATLGNVIARSDLLTLERDGTSEGLLIRYPAGAGVQTINGMGFTSAGASIIIHTFVNNPASAGVIQLVTSAQRAVHLQLCFGNTRLSGQVTQVVIDRYDDGTTDDNYWVGTVISTYNQ